MYAPGHAGIALLVFAPVGAALLAAGRRRAAVLGCAIAVLFASSPDVDLYVAALSHRGLTHTVWFVLGAGLVVGTVATVAAGVGGRGDRSPLRVGALVGVAVALSAGSHLLGDVVTPMGISPFEPVNHLHVTLSLVTARNPTANEALLFSGAASTVLYWTHGTVGVREAIARASARPTLSTVREVVAGRVPAARRFR